jgi:cytochrome bd-type quinol oxidase subunit 2
MLCNSIGLTYHIFQGSYSKQVELFRKIHAISAFIYLIIFVTVFFVLDNPANENELTFIVFWGIPPLFLVTYFFITWQDWKAMKKLNSESK